MPGPKVGDVVERDGLRFTVTHVMPRLTPYRRANQDTRVEGWTLGLVKLPEGKIQRMLRMGELLGTWTPDEPL